jgi:hypothetical protein
MQANDDNENEDDALEGLALLEQQNPYQGAPIHREEQFLNSNGQRREELVIQTLLSLQRSVFNA